MTYFQLRKREHEPEPDGVDEGAAEAEDEPESEPRPAAKPQPTGWPGAIWCGMCGPWRWLAGHFGDYGVTIAWSVHVGSPWAFFFYRGWVAIGLALAWPLAFLLFIPREYKDRASVAIERLHTRTPKPSAAPAPGTEREAVRRLLLDALGEAPGVHLNTVLAHLQEHGQWEGKTVTDLRARLAHLGIPHDRKVKVAGVPTWGVRRRDLVAPSPPAEPPPSPAPSPAV